MRSDPDKTKVSFLIERGGFPCGCPFGFPCGFLFGFRFGFPFGFPFGSPFGSPCGFPVGFAFGLPFGFPILESNWHHSRTLAVCNAILSTGMGPIFKNVALVREWCVFLRHQNAPLGPTKPGGQGQQGGKRARNFEDFWGRKPIGNTPLE